MQRTRAAALPSCSGVLALAADAGRSAASLLPRKMSMSQKPDVTIRRANPEDAGLLAELGARTFAETFAADNTSEDMVAYIAASFNLTRQTDELADTASTFFIAEVGGIAAGYAKLHTGEPEEGIEGAK